MKIYPRLQANTTLLARDAPNLIEQGESQLYINLALPPSLCHDSSALKSPHQQLSSTYPPLFIHPFSQPRQKQAHCQRTRRPRHASCKRAFTYRYRIQHGLCDG